MNYFPKPRALSTSELREARKVSVKYVTLLIISMIAVTLIATFITTLTTFPAYADETPVGGPGVVTVSDEPVLNNDSSTASSITSPSSPSAVYAGIPLTSEEVELMARMAVAETMYHDGTCPANTVRACYETMFNRYLYHATGNTSGSYKFYRTSELSMYNLLTKKDEVCKCSQSRFDSLSESVKAEYRNLVWQVHNQGPTILTTEFLFWQSSGGTRGKSNRIWVGWIYDENGNIVEGTTTDPSKIKRKGGNWYRITFK